MFTFCCKNARSSLPVSVPSSATKHQVTERRAHKRRNTHGKRICTTRCCCASSAAISLLHCVVLPHRSMPANVDIVSWVGACDRNSPSNKINAPRVVDIERDANARLNKVNVSAINNEFAACARAAAAHRCSMPISDSTT